jgi:hypothetical protein
MEKLHNEELHILYSFPNIIRHIKSKRMRWAGHVARMGGHERKFNKILVWKPEEERPLYRPRRSWEDAMRMDLRDIGWGVVDWIRLAKDRDRWRAVVTTAMNLRVLTPHLRQGLTSGRFPSGFTTKICFAFTGPSHAFHRSTNRPWRW